MKLKILELKQFIKWKIIYNPKLWRNFTLHGYWIWLWNIPFIIHVLRFKQPGDNGLPLSHNCKFGWKHMSVLERIDRRRRLNSR